VVKWQTIDVWAWDIVFDRTDDGRSFQWLTLIDEDTRESQGSDPANLKGQIR
jgi:hypothetical protein